MNKYNYYKISNSKKIRYLKNNQRNSIFIVFLHGFMSDLEGKKPKAFLNFAKKNSIYIVFLHGFMSDLEGKKPKAFLNFAKKNKLGFLAIEYSGHGQSSGKFTNGNITKWSNEATFLISKIVKKNDFILIGSSMGAWISLNQFKIFQKQIKGFLGIGPAPEFLEHLMWKKFSKKMKREILTKGIINLDHGEYKYPITYQLIKDGRKNKVLSKSIHENLKVTMVHGEKDKSVPVAYSRKILRIFKKAKKKLIIVKNGDHSLSSKKWLDILINELKLII